MKGDKTMTSNNLYVVLSDESLKAYNDIKTSLNSPSNKWVVEELIRRTHDTIVNEV